MVVGELKQYVCETIKGDTIYVSSMPNFTLGGLIKSKTTIPLDFTPIINADLSKALLEIGVTAPREKFLWRLKVNGVPIAREFKPQVVARLKNRIFAKVVYDISPVLKSPGNSRKNRVNVTIKYEGSDRIVIEHIGLLAFYSCDDALGNVSLLSGALALEPGEVAKVNLKHPQGLSVSGTLRTMLILPNPKARTTISFNNNHTAKIEGVIGGDEVLLHVDNITEDNVVEIRHEEPVTQYYPKELLVSSILLSQTQYNEPKLEIVDIKYPEKLGRGDKIKVTIANKGVSKPDKAVLTLMVRGQTVFQEKIELLEPGQQTTVEVPVNLPKGEHQLVFRTIWRKLAKTSFNEKRINVNVD